MKNGSRVIAHATGVFMLAGLFVSGLGACTPTIDARGNAPDPDRLAMIKPGKLNRTDVAEILGTPSSTAVFDQETWYYISSKTQSYAFFEPEVLERNVVVVKFDTGGMVADVKTYDGSNGIDFEPVDRTTPTAGNEITILEQLMGNVGRFSKQAGEK